jgi:hypothetical protein
MSRKGPILAFLLLIALLAGCNWPLSHLETEPLAAARESSTEAGPTPERRATGTEAATAFVSPLVTPPSATDAAQAATEREVGPFSGRSLRFDLPAGYRALEGLDGGSFVYPESLPGFLILYPEEGEPAETLAGLLDATPAVRRVEPPLQVELGGLPFVGLFVETEPGDRLFLAAADGWGLVVQGPASDWASLAAGLNRVLVSLAFQEVN